MAKYNLQIREEELKNKVAADFFSPYDTTQIVGNIDFSVALPTGCAAHSPAEALCLDLFDADFFLWGEAKKGDKQDIDDSLVQLLITIIKAKTFNSYLPPLYLAAFDAEKIAFLPYDTDLQKQILFDEHLENTVDWKSVTPSDHHSAEFLKIKTQAAPLLEKKILFDYEKDGKDLQRFIRDNFKAQKQGTNKINITLNRMTAVFNRWLETVKPTIKIDWANLAKENIVPADFFLADALSKNNWSLGESLKVLLRTDFYMMNLKVKVGDEMMDMFTNVQFTDKQKAHQAFWNRYNRPPSKREREKMQERRDLLIEPDRRERKGAFFTPHQWVELSQEYLAQTLGENWQEEYYVWDCCAGTGNLLYGLTEKERIFASTLDDADVRFMQQQDFLLPRHVFQFDFLNDDLQDADKVPQDLRRILADPDLRKKLVIYINPPYAEAGTATQVTGSGANKTGVSNNTAVWRKHKDRFGLGIRELYVQFFIRIYDEIHGATLAEFSTLKILQGSAFSDFRSVFRAKLLKAFAVPAKTFDNVKGSFPIGFFIWDTNNLTPLSATSEKIVTNSPAPLAGRGTKGAGKIDSQLNLNPLAGMGQGGGENLQGQPRTINWGHNQNPQPKIMNNAEMREYRRELRSNGTPAEGGLWKMLKAKQVGGLQFRRQLSVGDYILDFYCPALRLAIELDGDYHYHWVQPESDRERERVLWEKYGIRVLRFENKVVWNNPQTIIDSILKHKQIMDYAQEDAKYLKWQAEVEEELSAASLAETKGIPAPPPNPLPASGAGELVTHDYETPEAGECRADVTNSPSKLERDKGGVRQPDYTDTIEIPKGYDTNPLRTSYCATLGQPLCRFVVDVYNHKGEYAGKKTISSESDSDRKITSWISSFGIKDTKDIIGYTGNTGPDFQHNQYLYIAIRQGLLKNGRPNNETKYSITKQNLIPICVYFAVRLCQEATWLNDRDQFLYPNDGWKTDYEFQADCLAYTLFHGQNRISLGARSSSPASKNNMRTGMSALQANHWIPFTEKEVGAQSLFTSHFMSDFLAGKMKGTHSSSSAAQPDLFSQLDNPAPYPLPASGAGELIPLQAMSPEAQAVMDAGRELWRYYHKQPDAQADASYYDIRRYFQGTDEKGRMNPDSEDKEYMRLWDNLKAALRLLAAHIKPKVYQYGFLLGSNLKTDTEQLLLEMEE